MAVRRLRMRVSVFIVTCWVRTGDVWTDSVHVVFAGTESGSDFESDFALDRDLDVIVTEDETFC